VRQQAAYRYRRSPVSPWLLAPGRGPHGRVVVAEVGDRGTHRIESRLRRGGIHAPIMYCTLIEVATDQAPNKQVCVC
jgi:hypothetical protein